MRNPSASLIAITLLAGCAETQPPGTYPLPVGEAFTLLAETDMDAFRGARQCGILIHFSTQARADESVTWRVASSGRPMIQFTARLSSAGPGRTRVAIEIPKAADGGEAYDGTQFYPRPALHQPLRPAVEELVASRLEGRPFDVSRVPRGGEADTVCNIQRAGLEHGRRFAVTDLPSHDSRSSELERMREDDSGSDPDEFGEPMDDTRPAGMSNW